MKPLGLDDGGGWCVCVYVFGWVFKIFFFFFTTLSTYKRGDRNRSEELWL